MSDSDSEVDDASHEILLQKLRRGSENKKKRVSAKKVEANELLAAISSTKNVSEARLSLSASDKKNRKAQKTLQLPLHRNEKEKILRTIGFRELKNDLHAWQPIVSEQKTAETMHFPLNSEPIGLETAAERSTGFIARTPLEKAMETVLAGSKNNLTNDTEYTEAELEIIRAMNAKEAQERCARLQKMRAIQGYQEAKFRRQAKIKSKNYHRIMKRQKRRQMLKEFDDLLLRDPEAAKEKLKELEKDRIYERASLKHRSANKFSKVLSKHAERDPASRAMLEDHTRFGRELKKKTLEDYESSGDEEDEEGSHDGEQKKSLLSLVQEAAVSVDPEEEEEEAVEAIAELRRRKEKRDKNAKERARIAVQSEVSTQKEKNVTFEEPAEWDVVDDSEKERDRKAKKRKRQHSTQRDGKDEEKVKDVLEVRAESRKDVEELMEEAEARLIRRAALEASDLHEEPKKEKRKKKKATESTGVLPDAMVDPANYLTMETADLSEAAADLGESNDQAATVAEAFADDDVIEDFENEKTEATEREKSRDIDLTLLGWGSWTGPGIHDKKKKFVVKPKEKTRKDASRMGLIISERLEEKVREMQPRSLPYPFTRTADFEGTLSQPIGKEWNSITAHQSVIQPAIKTQGGRVILPMKKSEVFNKYFASQKNDE